nr:hypothetical protein TetV2_00620 [Oceanusvirus sp.]
MYLFIFELRGDSLGAAIVTILQIMWPDDAHIRIRN